MIEGILYLGSIAVGGLIALAVVSFIIDLVDKCF
jgi:hypothetical protein